MKNYIKGIIFFIFIYILLNFFSGYLAPYIQNIFLGLSSFNKIQKFFLLFCIQEIIFIFLLFYSFKIAVKKQNIFTFFKNKFVKLPIKQFVRYVLGSFLVLIFFMSLIHRILMRFEINMPGFFGQQDVGTFVSALSFNSWYDVALMFISIVLIGPFIEELIYRGFIQELLMKNMSPKFSLLLSAFIFSFMHFDFSVLGNLFILSFFLTYIYYRTKSLYVSLFFHMLINFFTFFVLVFAK